MIGVDYNYFLPAASNPDSPEDQVESRLMSVSELAARPKRPNGSDEVDSCAAAERFGQKHPLRVQLSASIGRGALLVCL